MGIVAKIKKNNIEIFKKELSKKFIKEKIIFYEPKFIYNFYSKGNKFEKQKSLLENYIFCNHEIFKKFNIANLNYTKGLHFFLNGCESSQKSIINFIKICKVHEDDKGFIQNSFFKDVLGAKGKFISGPFKNLIFDLIKKNNNSLKISIGGFLFTVSDKVKYIYRPA